MMQLSTWPLNILLSMDEYRDSRLTIWVGRGSDSRRKGHIAHQISNSVFESIVTQIRDGVDQLVSKIGDEVEASLREIYERIEKALELAFKRPWVGDFCSNEAGRELEAHLARWTQEMSAIKIAMPSMEQQQRDEDLDRQLVRRVLPDPRERIEILD